MKLTANAISWIFQPLLMLTYMLILLLLVNPYLFGVNGVNDSRILILQVFITTFLLPGFAIFMMWRLKLIKTVEMRDKQDRTGPFIATGVFYLWTFRSALADSNIPTAFLIAILGATLGLFACFFVNIFFKISLHATGVGGFLGMVLITMWLYSYGSFTVNLPIVGSSEISINLVLMLSLLMTGLVGTARLILHAHSPKEIYSGFAMGLLCQLIALKTLV